jgi:hypothetical protein
VERAFGDVPAKSGRRALCCAFLGFSLAPMAACCCPRRESAACCSRWIHFASSGRNYCSCSNQPLPTTAFSSSITRSIAIKPMRGEGEEERGGRLQPWTKPYTSKHPPNAFWPSTDTSVPHLHGHDLTLQ